MRIKEDRSRLAAHIAFQRFLPREAFVLSQAECKSSVPLRIALSCRHRNTNVLHCKAVSNIRRITRNLLKTNPLYDTYEYANYDEWKANGDFHLPHDGRN